MNSLTPPQRIAVCSWSLQAATPQELAAKIQETGISRVQLALDPLREEPAVWGATEAVLKQAGIQIISGMFGCVGEDYSTLDTIRETGGIAPDETWDRNLENIRATVEIATALGLKLVTFHAGFVPHNPADPDFAKMVARLKTVAEIFAAADISVGLETGQETADGLATLLGSLRQPNVVVNFDPANMLLYDMGDPIRAVEILGPDIATVHCKDAFRPTTPGEWGQEVPLGEGAVNMARFIETLKKVGYAGPLVIEREVGSQQERLADCAHGIRVLRDILAG